MQESLMIISPEWPWRSYAELIGERKRYRLVDRDHLATASGRHSDTPAFKSASRHAVEQVILAWSPIDPK